jgi:hypothetical protein
MTRFLKIGYGKNECGDLFKVISAKKSTEYLPGTVLTRKEVDALCHDRNWEVTLVQLDMTKEVRS